MDSTVTLVPTATDPAVHVPIHAHPPPPLRVVAGAPRRIRVWDLPLRLFHWGLVAAVTVSAVTAWVGGDWMPVHGIAGICTVGLLAFRVVWGLIGSTHSRFASFAPTPRRVREYLRGRWKGVGHNPLGALSVFVLLGLLATQALTGLFGNDDIAFAGPLAGRVDESLSRWLTGLHHQVADMLLVFLALHVLAIVGHRWLKKDDLVTPMVTGHKRTDHGESTRGGGPWALTLALGVAVLAVGLATGVLLSEASGGGGSAPPQAGAQEVPGPVYHLPQQERVAPEAPPAW